MKNLTFLFLFLFVAPIGIGQITSEFIDSLVQSALDKTPQAGVAIAVVKDGEVIHSKGYGLRSVKTGEKVDENTLFSIASNSKAFTTMALGMLIDEGKLSWTDKVVQYIPEFEMYDPYVTAHFTILDLVTHRSGLGLGAGDLMFIPDGSDFTVDDVVRSFQYQTPVSEFRTKYDYDNLLYIVAGEVIHRVSGTPWDSFIEQRIMRPLGMSRSAGYFENVKDLKNVAMPHSNEHGELRQLEVYRDPNKLFGPAGGIYASVNDLTKWMLCNLNGGTLGETKLVSEDIHRELWTPYTNIGYNATPKDPYRSHYKAYGLGWNLTDQNGYTIVSHTGGMPGMLSHTILIPELNVGIVVLTNTAPGGLGYYSLTHAIKDEFLGMDRRDWVGSIADWAVNDESESDEVVNAVWETVKKAKAPNRSDYMGTYEDDWFGEVTIGERNGKLWFTSRRSPKLNGEMFYYQANTYAVKWEYREMNCDAFVSFTLDENGKATSFVMKGIAPNMDFSFDFQDLDFHRIENDKE